MIAEQLPDPPRVLFDRAAVDARDAQRLHRDALRVEHPDDVVIGDDDERRGIGERLVMREQPRIDVAVRAHQRQPRALGIQRACGLADDGNRAEVAIGVEHGGPDQGAATKR